MRDTAVGRSALSVVCVWCRVADSGSEDAIPLPNVKTAILQRVLQYCEHHKENPPEEIAKPLKSTNLAEVSQRERERGREQRLDALLCVRDGCVLIDVLCCVVVCVCVVSGCV